MNLPNFPGANRVLYLGIGGGYDIYGAIPIYEALTQNNGPDGHVIPENSVSTFANVSKEIMAMGPRYAPFFQLNPAHGAVPLGIDIDRIIQQRNIDTIIAVDGGVDCLMQGNEANSGTVLGDFVTLAALSNLKKTVSIVVACVGLGCEAEEQMNYYAVMQNISQLVQNNGFYGSCSLIRGTEPHIRYKIALEACNRKSHIQTRVLAAAEGQFGEFELGTDANLSQMFMESPVAPTINPLMSIYWFFDFKAVASQNQVLPALANTRTMSEALTVYRKHVTRTRLMKSFVL